MIRQSSGILFDLYESKNQGWNSFWIIEPSGERNQYFHELPIKFYIYSSNENLRDVWKFLKKKWPLQIRLSKDEKIHPFDGKTKPFLAVETKSHYWNKQIARSVRSYNPGLELYDVGHPLLLNYSAFHNLFIFCKIDFSYDDTTKKIVSLESKEERWELDYSNPNLRTINIKSEYNPKVSYKSKPIILEYDHYTLEVELSKKKLAFEKIYNIFQNYDPDIILSDYGDNMIFPFLLEQLRSQKKRNIFSRDICMGVKIVKASSIESYGRVIHKKQQSLLYGRHHIDRRNMNFYTELGIETVYEIARISGMPLQEVARSTPGRAVASLEIIEALKTGTCIPYKKQKPEIRRNFNSLISADRGGMIFQPLIGVYENVISADFDSMFPSIMVFKNLSPETVGKEDAPKGVIPRALEPLLMRRLYYKRQSKIKSINQELYKSRSDALKWLLVVSFGYNKYYFCKVVLFS